MLLGTWAVVTCEQDEPESNRLLGGVESMLSLTVHSCGEQTFHFAPDKPERERTGRARRGVGGEVVPGETHAELGYDP